MSCCIARAAGEFTPGERWTDADGHSINAHGGGILLHEGTYYWYGESKSGRTFLPDCNKSWGGTRVDVTGVSCYSSTNLYQWKNEGLALKAVPDDARHELYPTRVLERPKVVFNRATKRFVMWMHIDSADYKAARAGVAISSSPTGPFKYIGSCRPNAGIWPLNVTEKDKVADPGNVMARDYKDGQMARDMTVFVDDDEKAYLFYSSEELAERIRTIVAASRVEFEGNVIPVTVSIGVASLACCPPGASLEQLITVADERLYAAKEGGRNRSVGAPNP